MFSAALLCLRCSGGLRLRALLSEWLLVQLPCLSSHLLCCSCWGFELQVAQGHWCQSFPATQETQAVLSVLSPTGPWQWGLESSGWGNTECRIALLATALPGSAEGIPGLESIPRFRQKHLSSFFPPRILPKILASPIALPSHSRSSVPLLHLWALSSL